MNPNVIKLCRGGGQRSRRTACWMSALNLMIHPEREWTDLVSDCISAVVNSLGMAFNDVCTPRERMTYIGPNLFAPLGTKTTDEDESRRFWIVINRAIQLHLTKSGPCLFEEDEVRAQTAQAGKEILNLEDYLTIREATFRKMYPGARFAITNAVDIIMDSGNFIEAVSHINASFAQLLKNNPGTRKSILEPWLQIILDCCAVGRTEIPCEMEPEDVARWQRRETDLPRKKLCHA